jgi:hypothetical protein
VKQFLTSLKNSYIPRDPHPSGRNRIEHLRISYFADIAMTASYLPAVDDKVGRNSGSYIDIYEILGNLSETEITFGAGSAFCIIVNIHIFILTSHNITHNSSDQGSIFNKKSLKTVIYQFYRKNYTSID